MGVGGVSPPIRTIYEVQLKGFVEFPFCLQDGNSDEFCET
jgi:hypothetical protein